MAKRSKYDILNVGFGVLNPEYASLSGKNYNPNDNSSDFFNLLYKAINLNNQTKPKSFNGPMVGVCLRNEGRVSQSGWIDPTCWAALSSDIVEGGSAMDLVQIRVRVPELHAEKKIPIDLPDRFTNDPNHEIINEYPVFISQIAGVSEPNAGDLVWIDFQDRNSYKGGIYLGVAEASTVSKSEDDSVDGDLAGKFKKEPRIAKVAGGTTSSNTTSRIFITGDSNVVRMTQVYSGGSGDGKIDEFASFYPTQASNGDLYQNPKGGIGWKGIYERVQYFDGLYTFRSGDVLIAGFGGNESFNSLIIQDDKKNRNNPKFPGKYGSETGYSLEYFKNSGVDVKNQKYSDLNLLSKPIKESSKGYQNFENNSNWQNLSSKLVELKDRGVTIKIFGPPVGGAPWRYINRAYIDKLQKHWFDKNGIKYISIIKKSQKLKPNLNDVHYWNDDPSYTKFFNTLYAPEL